VVSNYTELSDPQLFEQLEKANLAEKLEVQPEWAMLKEAANRISERAVMELAVKCKPSDLERVIQLQTIIKKYKYGLFDEIKILKMESEQLMTEAMDRGLIGGWLQNVKEKLGL
jgi:hypothetical protein